MRTFLFEETYPYRLHGERDKMIVRHFFSIDEETIELMNKYLRENKAHRSLVVFDLWEGVWVEYRTHKIREMMRDGTEL